MNAATTARLRDATSTVKSPSLLGTPRKAPTTVNYSPPDQLDNIFQSVRRQINRWGENAKWKIDLVLLDNPNSRPASPAPPHRASPAPANRMTSPSVSHHDPLFSPQQHARSQTVISGGDVPTHNHTSPVAPSQHHLLPPIDHPHGYTLPVCPTAQYPWDYVVPIAIEAWQRPFASDEMQQKLRDSLDRERHLENIVRSQAEQIRQSPMYPPDANKVIDTMRSIYLMSENEQRQRYIAESKISHRNTEALSKKLRRMSATLQRIEKMELPPEDTKLDRDSLLEERKLLKRRLHLADLRLSARDAELDYLHEILRSYNAHPPRTTHDHAPPPITLRSPTPQKQHRRGPPYLFQQQYSPKLRSEIRPQHISGLDSLGILADQMLSNPDFDSKGSPSKSREAYTGEGNRVLDSSEALQKSPPPTDRVGVTVEFAPQLDERRSKRSIDSANALLSMPRLMFLSGKREQTETAEPDSVLQEIEAPAAKKSRMSYVRWTQEEDSLLRRAVEQNGTSNWDMVAKVVPNRSNQQCRQRWSKYLDPNITEGSGTPKRNNTDARQSPSIAALLDSNEDMKMREDAEAARSRQAPAPPIIRYSPHATPPLAHAHEVAHALGRSTVQHGPHPPEGYPPGPGYRPPSPISTPKRKQTEEFRGNGPKDV
ncbi:hypothetical protein DFQ28_004133 [Apophysomyces sp. BC1034]|nr:hypothetical protein DFQ30_004096 [Apophysomyces sp. BC1015]KAG0178628.1 hypothetical protein DFQ29_003231 [Apophysomyces sp. BC1021]KAG0188953.1 hypothetical protein DFQ28_004133 [Apophysomyces sp. BC1034]